MGMPVHHGKARDVDRGGAMVERRVTEKSYARGAGLTEPIGDALERRCDSAAC